LSERQKRIFLAEKSDFHWSLIWEYKRNDLAEDSDDEKKDYLSRSQSTYPSQAKLGSQQDKVGQQQKGAFRSIAS